MQAKEGYGIVTFKTFPLLMLLKTRALSIKIQLAETLPQKYVPGVASSPFLSLPGSRPKPFVVTIFLFTQKFSSSFLHPFFAIPS